MENKNIYIKLKELQTSIDKIRKTKNNPYFKNKYADINLILDAISDKLLENGLVILQAPQANLTLKTEIIDVETSEKIISETPLIGCNDMQKLGSAITYARRYAIVSMLCLEQEDDDGNKASGKDVKKPAEKPGTKQTEATSVNTAEHFNAVMSLIDALTFDNMEASKAKIRQLYTIIGNKDLQSEITKSLKEKELQLEKEGK